MAKFSIEDKKREILRRQLNGKEVRIVNVNPKIDRTEIRSNFPKTFPLPSQPIHLLLTETLDVSHLAKDLTKVLIFSFLAIGLQLTFYFLLQHNLVRLSFW